MPERMLSSAASSWSPSPAGPAAIANSGACRWRHSHHTSRPKDSASRARAAARTAWVRTSGSTSAAATVSVMPWVAATTLRQSRRGSGARIHSTQPAGDEEGVAGGADGQHPPAGRRGDVHAQGEDQERVDLAVHARAQPRRRAGAPRDPSVDEVERERDGRERHQRRHRDVADERVRGQRRDADGERRPGQGDPAGRPQPFGAVAEQAERQRRVQRHAARRADEPPGGAEADGRRRDRQQQRLREQPGQRPGQDRPQPASESEHSLEGTVDAVNRFGRP